MLVQCIYEKLLWPFFNWSLDEFWQHQLPNMLIANYSVSFRKPIRSEKFYGKIEIKKNFTTKKDTIFLSTDFTFTDDTNGLAKGNALCAILREGKLEG